MADSPEWYPDSIAGDDEYQDYWQGDHDEGADNPITFEVHVRFQEPTPTAYTEWQWFVLAIAMAILGLAISYLATVIQLHKPARAASTANTTITTTATAEPIAASASKPPLPEYMPADFAWVHKDPLAVFNATKPSSRHNVAAVLACRAAVKKASRALKSTWHPDKARVRRQRGGEMVEQWQLEAITKRLVDMTVFALLECGEPPKGMDEDTSRLNDDEVETYVRTLRRAHELREGGDFEKARNVENMAEKYQRPAQLKPEDWEDL